MERRQVVTAFLEHDGKILLLRRSDRVGTYQRRWAGVSGSIDPGRTPEEQVRLEIREETGLTADDVQLIAVGEPLAVDDPRAGRLWLVFPFRFRVRQPERIRLDWEHTEQRWIDPAELTSLETVPNLAETWERVQQPTALTDLVASIANDREHGASWLARAALRAVEQCAERSRAVTPGALLQDVSACALSLIEARPGMAPIRFWLEWLLRDLGSAAENGLGVDELRSAVGTLVASLVNESERSTRQAATNAATQLATASVVFTASYSETVLEACRQAHRAGQLARALVAESSAPGGRRYGQDLADALRAEGVAAEVVDDHLIPRRVVDATVVWLGADSVLSDGSVLNGTPSRALAEAAQRTGRPVIVICESAKLDLQTSPEAVVVPSGFERVPAALVTMILTEQGEWQPSSSAVRQAPPDRAAEASAPPADPNAPSGEAEASQPGAATAHGPGDPARALVARIAEALLRRRETLAVAESAAGGRLGDLLTDRPGSSAWFCGGILPYSNAGKQRVAGLSPEALAEHGAVSPETAIALADSARRLYGATWGIGETGIAGPQTGRRSSKPAGLAYVAVVGPNGKRRVREVNTGFDGRAANKQAFALAALGLLAEELVMTE